jgi:hypothetical protein
MKKAIQIVFVAMVVVMLGVSVPTQASEKRVFWAGYRSGIWSSNTDGSDPQHVMDTSWPAPYVDWHPRGLFCDPHANKVYTTNWSDDGERRIQRMNFDGTGLEDVLSEPDIKAATDLALDFAGRIYWTEGENRRIRRAYLDGSRFEDLYVSGNNELCGLTLDPAGGKMYWTEYSSHRIRRANLDGSGAEDLVTGLDRPRHIDLDLAGGKMYWTELASKVLQRANLDGTSIELLVTSIDDLGGVSLDVAEGKMYYRDKVGLLRANLNGTGIERLTTYGSDTYPADVVVTPEPATLALLTLGGLAVLRRRQK